MSSITTNSPTPIPTGAGAGATTSRLLDRDPSKFRSIKQVIVVGQPGAGIDAIAEALRILNFKVYDFVAASDRHARDFPLWVEAARLRSEGKPYNQSDYDKLIGDHNALVGAPTCFFNHDFIKLYPNVKVVMVAREPDADTVKELLEKLNKFAVKKVMNRIDPEFFGNISKFLELACQAKVDHQAIRDTVREKNLLEIDSLNDWKPLCDFLEVRIPKERLPSMDDSIIVKALAQRPLDVLAQLAEIHGQKVFRGLEYLCTAAGISWSATVLFNQRGAAVLGFVIATLITALYWTNRTDPKALEPQPSTDVVAKQKPTTIDVQKSQASSQPQRQDNRRNHGKQDRGRQNNHQRAQPRTVARPDRPVLPGWGNVQVEINKDDLVVYQERMALAKGMEGQQMTFNEVHKERVD